MKQTFRKIGLLVVMALIALTQVSAQMQMPPIPTDPNVRIGKLDNGLTYYIRHNEKPENRVEMYIAQKVGSILEEPRQRGLAHFLEHMAFNGTKNFPTKKDAEGVVDWCEKHGIKFGTDLNAYTSVDETVYNINNIPTTNPAIVDSCLLILHDWSNFVLLEDEEIDKERGVIREEWRSRDNGMMRLYTEAQSVLYPGDKYADCMPIGSMDVVNNFPYKDLRDYYEKWYRPDLQGIIIVGDINVDEIEGKIKTMFADIPKPVNPAERIYYPVADNDEPIVYIGSDPEITNPTIMVFFKTDAFPNEMKNNMTYLLTQSMINLGTSMLNSRFGELRQSANPPFIYAAAGYEDFFLAKTKEAFTIQATSKGDGVRETLQAILTEVQRMKKFGFTASEYERARADFMQMIESAYNEREKTENVSYVAEYQANFLDNEPIPGIEYEYQLMSQLAPNIPVDAINQLVMSDEGLISKNNRVIFIAIPESSKESCPTKEEVIAMLKNMDNLEVTAYEDKVSDEPLMAQEPTGGSIVSETANQIYGTTKLVLNNGIEVYLKPTDFKADEILMAGTSEGGSSLYPDKDILDISVLNSVATLGGLGNFSQVDLQKVLAGKKVSVNASVGGRTESISGSSSPKDFETMLQLTYLRFTAPRQDADAFASYKARTKSMLESAKADPLNSLNDSLQVLLYGHHPRVFAMQPEHVDQINYDKVMQMFNDRFSDAGDFKFFFVGNIDLETAKPLIAKYLGSLPSNGRKEASRDTGMRWQKGLRVNEYAKPLQTPQATIFMGYTGKVAYTLRNSILMSVLYQALDMDFTEQVREQEGGTYGVTCMGQLTKYPEEEEILQIVYQTDPTKRQQLNTLIDKIVAEMAQNGPSEAHLQKVKEYMQKQYTDNQKENSYWLGNLSEYFDSGVDFTQGFLDIVNSLTAKDVQQFANDLLKQGNKATLILTAQE